MLILYCIPTLGPGGAERQLSYLAAGLAAMGHDVHVASVSGGPNGERLMAAGVKWHHIGGLCNYDPTIFFKLIGLIRKLRPDVIQTSLAQMDILGGVAARLTRTRWVLRESSAASFYARGWKNRLRFVLGRHADAIVSNSAGGAAYWRSAQNAREFHVIPNAIPFDEIACAEAATTTEGMFGRTAKVVLSAGRMNSGKNVEHLIAALARIADDVPFNAILCADGPLRPRLEQMAQELGLAHRLLFAGYVTNLWSLMKGADVFVSLSEFEGCPNVVLEAMACGCPMVVSDIPAHREILDEGTACFVSQTDTEAVAAAIKANLNSDKVARERVRATRTQAAERTIEKMAKLYERLYLKLLAEA